MKLITKQSLIDTIADRWDAQFSIDQDPKSISYKLRVLKSPTVDKINSIIGNDSWTTEPIWCNECDTAVPVAVEVGEDYDMESATATLCLSCLFKGVELING